MTLSRLRERSRTPELMDDPELDAGAHEQALRALARVNRLSGTARGIWPLVRAAHRADEGRPVRVLDVACGGGDVLAWLGRRARKEGVPIRLAGCDISPRALEHAAARLGGEQLTADLDVLDVTRDPLPGPFDVVACSLFLHHLTDDDAVKLLARMTEAARVAVVQDLRRTAIGLALAWGTLRVISRSAVARIDGPRSVRAARSVDEVRALADRAALSGVRIERVWPQRLRATWAGRE